MDDEKTPVRRLGLKPREVIPTDARSRPGDGTEISIALMIKENQLAEARLAAGGRGVPAQPAPEAGDPAGFKRNDFTPVDPPARPGDDAVITVDDILRENQERLRAAFPELIAMPVRRKSRRNRDFALILGTAAIAGAVLVIVFRHDLPVIGLALSAIALLVLVFTWILFGVMDKY